MPANKKNMARKSHYRKNVRRVNQKFVLGNGESSRD
jgi:hypothetical protein